MANKKKRRPYIRREPHTNRSLPRHAARKCHPPSTGAWRLQSCRTTKTNNIAKKKKKQRPIIRRDPHTNRSLPRANAIRRRRRHDARAGAANKGGHLARHLRHGRSPPRYLFSPTSPFASLHCFFGHEMQMCCG